MTFQSFFNRVVFLFVWCCVAESGTSYAANGDVIRVNSPIALLSALDSVTGGEVLQLASGDYDSLDIHNRTYSSFVTIESVIDGGARFSNIEFKNSSYVRVDSVTISYSGREGVSIFDESHHIDVINSEVFDQAQFDRNNPMYTQVSSLYAVSVGGNSHNIRIENIDAHDVKSSAYLFSSISDSVIKGNRCDWVAADCFKLASVDGILFENNFGASNIHSSPTAHVDFVQGQGAVSNSVFRGNVALISSSQSFQGLFFDDATFTNLTFEDNLISTSAIRGISVSSPNNGTPSSSIVVRNNTVLIPGGAFKTLLILVPGGSTVEDNIVSSSVTKNPQRLSGTNFVLQWDDDDDIAQYDDYYVNADRGRGATIEDFRPVAGSAAENKKGAFRRIFELLNGGSTGGSQDRPGTPTGSVSGDKVTMTAVLGLLLEG